MINSLASNYILEHIHTKNKTCIKITRVDLQLGCSYRCLKLQHMYYCKIIYKISSKYHKQCGNKLKYNVKIRIKRI